MRYAPCSSTAHMTGTRAQRLLRMVGSVLLARRGQIRSGLAAATVLAVGTAMAGVTSFSGPGSGPGRLRTGAGLSADRDGYVYVADLNSHCIHKFDGEGNFVREFGSK